MLDERNVNDVVALDGDDMDEEEGNDSEEGGDDADFDADDDTEEEETSF